MNKVRATYKRLDYNNGDFLAHYQWRGMQDSVMFVWKGLFQDDEDGMSENKKIVDAIKENVSKSLDYTGKICDIMCNLTSLSMGLEYFGISKPCPDCHSQCNSKDQLEDYLE